MIRKNNWLMGGQFQSMQLHIKMCDFFLQNRPKNTLAGHLQCVTSLAFTPDGLRIISGSLDTTVSIHDVATGSLVCAPLRGHTHPVQAVACSPDGRRIASASADGTICLWNAAGSLVCGPLKTHSASVSTVAFSPDSQRLVTGSDDKILRVWSTYTGEAVSGPLEGHRSGVTSAVYTADGQYILSASFDNTVCVRNAHTLEVLGKPLRGHSDWVRAVACSPNSRGFASADHDGKIYIYDLPHNGRSNALAYRRWWEACLRMKEDGWVRDEEGTLLLWVPMAHRVTFQSNARVLIDNGASTVFPYVSDLETLLRFSGRNWRDIFLRSPLDDTVNQ